LGRAVFWQADEQAEHEGTREVLRINEEKQRASMRACVVDVRRSVTPADRVRGGA
jgi:hypothetical protein